MKVSKKHESIKENKFRIIKISTVSLDSALYGNDSMHRMRRVESLIADAVLDKPDLVLLPEVCLSGFDRIDNPNSFVEVGDVCFEKLKKMAIKYNIYIVAAVLFSDKGKFYNSMLVFSPEGELEYVYNKSFLTLSELAAGLSPGALNQKCWDAPWGKTAFVICFDLNFDELFENYRKQGAQLLLFSSYFPGGMLLRSRALSMRAFAVSSHAQGYESVFIDRIGREFARTNLLDPAITRKINLNSAVLRVEADKFKKLKAGLGENVEIEMCRPEGVAFIAVSGVKESIEEIIKNYKLTNADSFLERLRKLNAEKR